MPALVLLLLLIPPPAPPPSDALAAAIALVKAHPSPPAVIDKAIADALEGVARGAVSQAYGGTYGGERWLAYRTRFLAQIGPMVAPHRDAIVAEAAPCVASGYAYALSPEDIAATDAFLSTPAGARFWSVAGPTGTTWNYCVYHPLRARIDFNAALVASGLPREGEPRLMR